MTEYRVTELAREAGTTVRNVRVYQDRGLLRPPRRQGRVGLYDAEHLARLRLIGQLLGRGYTFAIIRELFDAWSGGQDLADTLGLRQALPRAWAPERPARLTRAQLSRRFGLPFSPELMQRAIGVGLLREDGPAYLVESPNLLEAGADLVAAGVPLEAVLDLVEAQQIEAIATAERFVGGLLTHLAETPVSPEAGLRVLQLRPQAQRMVDALLLLALQRAGERVSVERPPADDAT